MWSRVNHDTRLLENLVDGKPCCNLEIKVRMRPGIRVKQLTCLGAVRGDFFHRCAISITCALTISLCERGSRFQTSGQARIVMTQQIDCFGVLCDRRASTMGNKFSCDGAILHATTLETVGLAKMRKSCRNVKMALVSADHGVGVIGVLAR